jgi:hypothetical protein
MVLCRLIGVKKLIPINHFILTPNCKIEAIIPVPHIMIASILFCRVDEKNLLQGSLNRTHHLPPISSFYS